MFDENDVKQKLFVQQAEHSLINDLDDLFEPKLTLGTISFQNISSSTNFFVLEPTIKFKEVVQDDKICLHILIGDTHNSIEGQCKGSDINVINTSSTGWFKILDSISSAEQPIDYFVENYFPFKLLQDPDLILNKDVIHQLKRTETPSLLTFIRDNYLPCFSSSDTVKELKQKHCFTKNIRYHMVDIRTTADSINLTNNQQKQNTNFYERYFYQAFLNFFRSLNSNEIISSNVNVKVEDFILLVLQNDLTKCASILFDENNLLFTKKSLIFKQIQKQKGSKNFFVNFCKEYWTFAIKNLLLFYEFENENKKLIDLINYRKQFSDVMKLDFGSSNISQKEYMIHAFKFNKVLKTFIHIVMFPFLDLYYMLRSWKQVENRSWCSVLNVGSLHAFLIVSFLTTKGYFTLRFAEGKVFEIETTPGDIIPMVDTRVSERCIKVTTSINLDAYSNVSFEVINNRKNFLGESLYIKMLDGYHLTKQELNDLCKQKQQDIHEVEKLFESL